MKTKLNDVGGKKRNCRKKSQVDGKPVGNASATTHAHTDGQRENIMPSVQPSDEQT